MNLVSGFLWSNAGFSSLRKIKELDQYEPRYDPTVIPVTDPSAPAADLYTKHSSGQDPAPNPGHRYYSVTDYHAFYRSGRLTPTDSVEALLPLIRRDTSPPGAHSVAFISMEVELARRAAEASTLRYKQGKPLGVLDGVPIAVKDEVDLDGYRKTLGSARDYTRQGGGTSWCVKKWEEEGAIILGKLNMHELGMGKLRFAFHSATSGLFRSSLLVNSGMSPCMLIFETLSFASHTSQVRPVDARLWALYIPRPSISASLNS